tara:strand:- start:3525 stop:3704 length:180 start_codon:yes stop_codon:yes gene_type:complete
MMRLIVCQGGRFAAQIAFDPPARMVAADNFRAAPLDTLQIDVLRAFVETLPGKGEQSDG